MPEVEYSTTAQLPVGTIWEFVEEMDNWAEFVAGYQSHEKESQTDSVWVLKGDVGVLARTVKFRVHVEEWAGPEKVRFTLEGLNEPMRGSGTFVLAPDEAEGDTLSRDVPAQRDGFLTRLLAAIARFFYKLVHGSVERAPSADSGPGAGVSRLTFRLALEPGGPMAPMVSALVKPMLTPAAEDLANKIMATLEQRHGGRSR
jgi:carbon monoxide dehydrogenase subunit G